MLPKVWGTKPLPLANRNSSHQNKSTKCNFPTQQWNYLLPLTIFKKFWLRGKLAKHLSGNFLADIQRQPWTLGQTLPQTLTLLQRLPDISIQSGSYYLSRWTDAACVFGVLSFHSAVSCPVLNSHYFQEHLRTCQSNGNTLKHSSLIAEFGFYCLLPHTLLSTATSFL